MAPDHVDGDYIMQEPTQSMHNKLSYTNLRSEGGFRGLCEQGLHKGVGIKLS
jgi:hypothetical protein